MSALDKVLAAANRNPAAPEDPGADLVAAAAGLLDELLVELAWDPDNDGDDDSSASGDTDKDYAGKKGKGKKKPPPFKKKGKASNDDDDDDEDDDDEDEKPSKKKVKATALAAAARLALAGLESRPASYNWVEATAAPLAAADVLALAKGEKPAEPYGDVEYADPGYRGKKRYPIDAKHIHAAIAYFSKAKNRAEYSSDQVKHIWGKIKSAARKHGVDMQAGPVSASALIELAADGADVHMNHPPFTGKHNHPHAVLGVHKHEHYHNNDSRHDCGNMHAGY